MDGTRDIFRRITRTAGEGKCVRVYVPPQCRFMHEAADLQSAPSRAVELLPLQGPGFATQDDSRATQVGLEFVECRLDFHRS